MCFSKRCQLNIPAAMEMEIAIAADSPTPAILEPVMILFVGAIVGFIVIAMYMPLFKVYDQIK